MSERQRTVHFFVSGDPVPQPRPRVRVIGKGKKARGQAYTPAKHPVKRWRQLVGLMTSHHIPVPLDGPVSVRLHFEVGRPGGHYGTGRNSGKVKPSAAILPVNARSGDVDNLAKAVLDGMNGHAFKDDSQVYHLVVNKQYADTGTPGVEVWVTPYAEIEGFL